MGVIDFGKFFLDILIESKPAEFIIIFAFIISASFPPIFTFHINSFREYWALIKGVELANIPSFSKKIFKSFCIKSYESSIPEDGDKIADLPTRLGSNNFNFLESISCKSLIPFIFARFIILSSSFNSLFDLAKKIFPILLCLTLYFLQNS